MKNDSKSLFPAEVDVMNASFSQIKELGIDFTNEIDVWTQMEFRARRQIKEIKQFGASQRHVVMNNLNSYYYSTRFSLEDN